MKRSFQWYLLLLFLAASGCTSAPIGYKDVLQLRTETVIDANTTQVGLGSAFAVSPKIILTALHCVDSFTTIKINNYKLDVVKVVPFGEDGAAIVVSNMPDWVKIYDITDSGVRGANVVCYGYNPVDGSAMSCPGIITAKGVSTALILVGMSGGPTVYNGKAIGINSSILPSLGVATFQSIPVDIVHSIMEDYK